MSFKGADLSLLTLETACTTSSDKKPNFQGAKVKGTNFHLFEISTFRSGS